MVFVYMNDPITGRVAIFEENGTTGDPEDPNSVRNAPLNNPLAHLAKMRFHNEFDYYQVHSITSVTITHPAVAGATTPVAAVPSFTRLGQVVKSHIALVNHGLPYVPAYMIASNGCLIGQSSQLQIGATGSRMISPYATASQIVLLDVGISTASALPAMNRTYQVIVFRQPVADSPWMADLDPANDVLMLGYGKWRGNLRQLRRTLLADASPFDVPLGATSGIGNGVSKTVLADGTTFAHPAYVGSFVGSPSIQCTVE